HEYGEPDNRDDQETSADHHAAEPRAKEIDLLFCDGRHVRNLSFDDRETTPEISSARAAIFRFIGVLVSAFWTKHERLRLSEAIRFQRHECCNQRLTTHF